jgi:hypothetical protein
MFLSTEKTKVVQASSDNLAYYNKMYDDMKSDAAKQAAVEFAAFVAAN